MKTFTGVEVTRLIGAMNILKDTQRASKLRRKIREADGNEVDTEDLGIFSEACKIAGDAVFHAIVTAGVYMKDERVEKTLDKWLEDMNAD